jgi:uncharacterized membrane protein YhfC
MSTLLLGVNFGFMVLLPAGLGLYMHHRRGASWLLYLAGAGAFILAQVAHIPFNWLILQRLALFDATQPLLLAGFLGLSAAAFETTARLLCFRGWARSARSRRDGLMVGLGHGGSEAILLGILGGINIFATWRILGNSAVRASLSATDLALLDTQLSALAGLAWYENLAGALERLLVLPNHLALSLLVMTGIVRGRRRWFWLALAWHALLDAAAVYIVLRGGGYWAELPIALLALAGIWVIWRLKDPQPAPAPSAPQHQPAPPAAAPKPVSQETLDRSRYL